MGDDLDPIAAARKGMTFRQAEGVDPLPSQCELREISRETAATLWATVHETLDGCVKSSGIGGYHDSTHLQDPWKTVLKNWWVLHEYQNVDEFPSGHSWIVIVKGIATSREYLKTFEFLQFVIDYGRIPYFAENIARVLTRSRSAYRIIDKVICPISTDEQAEAVRAAMAEARAAAARGPYAHLTAASRALSAGDWSGCVRESISAVEGAAKSIEPAADALGKALAKLEGTIGLKPALKSAYKSLYGWSSDEEGIRHANVFEREADVTERDAMFMFGACASFVGYLLSAKRELNA